MLDTTHHEPWEIAARLDMLLAYPNVSATRMTRLVNAACADQIAATIKAFPEQRTELVAKFPNYDPAKNRTERKHITTAREEALRVGSAILPLIEESATGKSSPLPATMNRLSLDQIVPFLWPRKPDELESPYFDRMHDVEKRQLRLRFPVAHLAAALQWHAREKWAAGETLSYDYQDLDFLRNWVAKANEIAGYIKSTPGLKTMASRLLDLHWIEHGQVSAPGQLE